MLFQPGDRIKFVPVTQEGYEQAEARIEDGTYLYNVVEYQRFSVHNYRAWVSKLDQSQRF